MEGNFEYMTTGDMVKKLGVSFHRLSYVIRTRNIQPSGKFGNCCMYSQEAFEAVRDAIAKLDERKSK